MSFRHSWDNGGFIMVEYKELMVKPGKKVRLKDFDPEYTGDYKDREKAEKDLPQYLQKMFDLQYKLYADNHYALLSVLQGIDAAGKDGVFRHVMSALNPQGVKTWSFKKPSDEEADHDYLWRVHKVVPNYGEIGLFNRSHYEDVLIVRVKNFVPKEVWSARYDQINQFEKYLYDNKIWTVKFFLYISKDEQEKRFLDRLTDPKKNWKVSPYDLAERQNWDAYIEAFEDMLNKTSTEYAPWYVIPGNKKWFRNICVARIMVDLLSRMDLKWPEPSEDTKKLVEIAKKTGKLPTAADLKK
jgi:PPK2 family polyphosphate:nucleotide phosphotransferase